MTHHASLRSAAIGALVLLAACSATVSATTQGSGTGPDGGPPPPVLPPPPDAPTSNLLGMNFSAPLDWEGTQMYADVVRQSRDVATTDGSGPVPVDGDGWPLSDFRLALWAGPWKMHGTYALSFTGQASVSGRLDISVSDLAYDPATNTSTAVATVSNPGTSDAQLVFVGTRRTPSSPVGSGVTGVKLMRPVSPGSSQSYPPSVLFHAPLKEQLSRFRVIRFMDYLATVGNQAAEWADRPLPSWMSFNRPGIAPDVNWQGVGGCWEHVVLFANELDRDAWVNIPVKASDDYVRKVALLLRYGSDGVNPYEGPQASPAYPPLAPHLKIYVEYSNELWNSFFVSDQGYNRDQAAQEVAAGGSPLNYDGSPDGWAARRVAKRGLEISKIFRSVFGDDAMMTRVRPMLMTHTDNSGATLGEGLILLHGYYNNGDGDYVADPHPPSHYFWGAGGSGYYYVDDTGLTIDNFWGSDTMGLDAWRQILAGDAKRCAAAGWKRVAYEGGPSLDGDDPTGVKAQAVMDPRMTTAVVDHHDVWSSMGGDLLVYFTAVHDYRWGFASIAQRGSGDVYELDTPKMRAVSELNGRPRAATTYGTAIPGALHGNGFSFSRNLDTPGAGGRNYTASIGGFPWAAYVFRTDAEASRTVTLSLSSASGTVGAYFDGVLLGTRPAANGAVTFAVGPVPAGLHGVIVRAVSGSFTLDRVAVD
jgi:hypothetical protein